MKSSRRPLRRLLPFLTTLFLLCSGIPSMAADVSFAWDASVSPNVLGYKLYAGNASRVYGTPVTLGNQTTYTLTGLTNGTWYFAVTAFDIDGNESGFSNEVSQTIGTPDTTPPVISSVASSNLTSSGATIAWTTNEASNTQVEYGTTTGYGTSSTLNSSLVTSHTQALSGLSAGTLYHYRVRSADAAGNMAVSGDYTFTTLAPPDITPPVISSVASSSLTTSGATIAWTTNEAANTQVEYGITTGYGASSTLNSSLVTSHSQALSGLSAGTLYHYRVRSADAAGNMAVSGDYTFTTLAPPDITPPVISSVASSNLTSSGATIAWTTNEAANTQVEYGITTGYGTSSTLISSLVTSHTQALSGLSASTLYHYRVKSADAAGNAAVSGDYTFTTPASPDITPPVISSVASSNLTSSGATIAWTTNEAANTQVEYGTTTGYGTSSTLISSLVTSHSQALSGLSASTLYHYRVKSADATGNMAVSVDYTFTTPASPDTTPPVISGVTSSSLTSSGATIAWTTNEAANTQVEYGTTTGYGTSSTLISSLVTSHSQALSGLSASTLYHYRVKSADAAGNMAVSGDYTFTTPASPDTTPPVISGVTSSSLTSSGATIAWTTNEAANTQVEYGTTTGYGTSSTLISSMVTSHSQALSGLSASTLYHYRVKSADAAGNMAVSVDYTFTTPASPDTTPPVISSVTSSSLTSSGATIAWTTNEAANTQVEYGTTTGYGTSSTLISSLVTSHSQALSGLSASRLYHYRVKSADAAGNMAVSGDYTFTTSASPDTTPPVISSVTSSSLTSSGATIAWTTNEAANTQVEYGTTTGYGASSTLNTSLVTSHTQALASLSASTLYHYRVRSADAAGNAAVSGDYTFTTPAPPDTTPPVISSVTSSSLTSSGATITWTTNEGASSRVDYGITTGYGTSSLLDSSMVTSHTEALSGLSASTLYHYRVRSADAAGNVAVSGDYTFTTAASEDPTLFAQWFRGDAVQLVGQGNPLPGSPITLSYPKMQVAKQQGFSSGTAGSPVANSTSAFRYRHKDTTPPQIWSITSQNTSNTGTTISWNTNEAADARVDYGETTRYGTSSIVNTSLVKNHSQALTALIANTRYHYRVRSRDAAGNLAISRDMVFTTSQNGPAPVISAMSVSEVAGQSARISWSTDRPSNSEVEYWSAGKTARKAVLGSLVTQHSITLNDLENVTQYQFYIKSTDSESVQAKSPAYSFTTLQGGISAVALPHFFNLQDQNELGEDVLEEVALTNLGGQAATLTLTAVDSEGNLITGQNIVNPSTVQVSSQGQSATLDMDIFGEGLDLSGSNGWIKVESTTPDVGGFSLLFGSNLNFVDGMGLGETPLTDFALTEIDTNGSTRINVANTNSQDATVAFDLMKADGTVRGTRTRVIQSNGALAADLFTDLFVGIAPDATNYVRAVSTKGVLSFELMKKDAGDIASLAGQDITAGGTVLYLPHYIAGSEWKTSLSVINLDSRAGSVQFQFVGENGVQIGTTNTLSIPANGKLYVNDPAFFQTPSSSTTYTGYLKISSDGVRLAGSAVYGNSSGTSFSSALPLVYNLQTSVVYWHAVSNDLYRSGIAIVNPNETAATAVVELFAADGTSIEQTIESIPAGRRTAKLLTEYFPSRVGQNQTSGYIKIISDKPLATYSLFGTGNLSVLSAIPGKTIQ